MSFLSAISTPHSHSHGDHRNNISRSQSHSPSKSTNDVKIHNLEQSDRDALSYLNIESRSCKSEDSFLREAQRTSSSHPSYTPKSDKFLPSIKYEKNLDSSFQLKSSELNQNALQELHDNTFDHGSKSTSYLAAQQKIKSQIESRSRITNRLLQISLRWPFFHAILSEKDSRRIFYFMSLNFSFMLVQAFYGFLTDSLGLISDSIHMFFDCLALAVGLFAAISSKWSPSPRFPFGFGKIESLSGFGNGVFLLLISVEIITEAIERLVEGRETKRLKELLIVSCVGLAVNLVGMACFGHHGHSGHGCGGHTHSHNHDHHNSQAQGQGHSHDHSHKHSQSLGQLHSYSAISQVDPISHPCCSHEHKKNNDILYSNNLSPGNISQPSCTIPNLPIFHAHSHEDDNLHGIFLHILADTMGSAAVILSTALIYITGFDGWDPIASCVIAILIFLSSIPLIKSSAKKLLLTLPDDKEYILREILTSISELRGVANYYAPRFWLVDTKTDGENQKVNGVIHIIAVRGTDIEDLRLRTQEYLKTHKLDVLVQVESDNDLNCWCGDIIGNNRSSIMRY
ncbi:putative zinc transporter cis4 [Erysiphe neolycopersici]|uniref:Zinc transporter n=1 Tax=Erysiphe neolycopersici TaxID=212602 RepID=A0A420HTP8_9PEZI|nr:putative zinc transporter cis4 [Erysiphe neolycopersici]